MNQIGYAEYIRNEIAREPENRVFTAEEICLRTAERFGANKGKMRYTVNVILNRLTGTDVMRYRKGMYYRPKRTVFGAVPMNPFENIYRQYVEDETGVIGYMTGPTLCQKIGLTTQIPKYRFYVSNGITGREKRIANANVVLRPPRVQVNEGNYRYLQVLDIIDNKDGVAYETDDITGRLIEIIKRFDLDFGRLVGMAKKYYPLKAVSALVDVAERSVV